MGEKLKAITNVASVEFVSKDKTLEDMRDELPAETFESMQGENNPLQDTYIVTLKDLDQFEGTVSQLKGVSGVDDVRYDGGIASMLTKIRQVVLAVGGWVILMLLLVSLFIIANTIKLTVYNRRLEIYIMKSVGPPTGLSGSPSPSRALCWACWPRCSPTASLPGCTASWPPCSASAFRLVR